MARPLSTALPRASLGVAAVVLLVGAGCMREPGELLVRGPQSDLPWSHGAYGGAVGDLDGDGRLDVILSPHGRWVGFYLNRGGLRFEAVGRDAQPPGVKDLHGLAACDVDADGLLDLYLSVGANRGKGISAADGAGNHLWMQTAPLRFENVANGTLLDDRRGRGRGAMWVQLDMTPFPELLVLNHAGVPRLFQREGLGWQDRHEVLFDALGPFGPSGELGATLVVAASDFDLDGDTDLYVDGRKAGILRNQGDGTFLNVFHNAGLVEASELAQAAAGDLDNDGDDDLVLTRLYGAGIDVWWNESSADAISFRRGDELRDVPLSPRQHGSILADLDNDGILDLYLIQRDRLPANVANVAARGRGDGSFEVRPDWGGFAAVTGVPIGGWAADLDSDGDLDLVLFHGDEWEPGDEGTVLIYQNTTRNLGVTVALSTEGGSPHGMGGRVELEIGDRVLVRQVQAANNRFCASVLPVHFGVGTRKGPFPLTIHWPDGDTQRLELPRAGASYQVRQGQPATVVRP